MCKSKESRQLQFCQGSKTEEKGKGLENIRKNGNSGRLWNLSQARWKIKTGRPDRQKRWRYVLEFSIRLKNHQHGGDGKTKGSDQSGTLQSVISEVVGTVFKLDKVQDVTMRGDGQGELEKFKDRPGCQKGR